MDIESNQPRFSKEDRQRQTEELETVSRDMRPGSGRESPEVEKIKKTRDERITHLEGQIPEAKIRGPLHEAEILESIENLREQADERIKAINRAPRNK